MKQYTLPILTAALVAATAYAESFQVFDATKPTAREINVQKQRAKFEAQEEKYVEEARDQRIERHYASAQKAIANKDWEKLKSDLYWGVQLCNVSKGQGKKRLDDFIYLHGVQAENDPKASDLSVFGNFMDAIIYAKKDGDVDVKNNSLEGLARNSYRQDSGKTFKAALSQFDKKEQAYIKNLMHVHLDIKAKGIEMTRETYLK